MTEIRFRRSDFWGEFADVKPKWHIHNSTDPGKWGTYVGMCGYKRDNILGDLTISKAKKRPKRAEMCARCLTIDAVNENRGEDEMDVPKHEKKTVTKHEWTIGQEDRPTSARTLTDGIGWVQRELASMGVDTSYDDSFYARAGDGGEIILFVEVEDE